MSWNMAGTSPARRPRMFGGGGRRPGQLRAKRRALLILPGAEIDARSGCTGDRGRHRTVHGDVHRRIGHITAMDISPDLLVLVRTRALSLWTSWRAVSRIGMGTGLLKAVIGSSVSHHLDMERTLPKMVQLLKPGGRMSFAEPNMFEPSDLLRTSFPDL